MRPKPPAMTEVQRSRLRVLSSNAVYLRQALYMAQIGEETDRLRSIGDACQDAQRRYQRALAMRGLLVGDTVRIVVDGPYKGREAEIQAMYTRDFEVVIDSITVVCTPHNVEFVEEEARCEETPLPLPEPPCGLELPCPLHTPAHRPTRCAFFCGGLLVVGTLKMWADYWEASYYGDGDAVPSSPLWFWPDSSGVPVATHVRVERGTPDEDDYIPYTITADGLPDRVSVRIDGRS